MSDVADLGAFPWLALALVALTVRRPSERRGTAVRVVVFLALFLVARWCLTPGSPRPSSLAIVALVGASIVLVPVLAARLARAHFVARGRRILPVVVEVSWFVVALPAVMLSAQVHRVAAPVPAPGRALGLAVTELSLRGDGGTRLRGLWLENPRARGAVLLVHGIGADAVTTLDAAASFVDDGFHVFAFDQRAHGSSDGVAATLGVRESGDVVAAWDALLERTRGLRGPRVLFGISMGGAAAQLAAPRLTGVDGLLLDSTFADVKHVAARMLPLPRLATTVLVHLADALSPIVVGTRVLGSPPVALARPEGCPVQVLHARRDPLIPFAQAGALVAAYGPRAKLTAFDLDTHAQSFASSPVAYDEASRDLIARARAWSTRGAAP